MLITDVYKTFFEAELDAETAVATDIPAVRARKQVALWTVPASAHAKPEVFQQSRIIVQCWAHDENSTAQLSLDLRTLVLRSKRELPGIHRVNIIGEPGRFNDPDDTAPRYQLAFDVLYRHAVI